ncbi:hypothetical protein BU25DRAFT_329375 [Macroventuria anomochaeta]|uniref:Uncharacterized protein n=1 Tax=Macroventuria anomochaeta TaxID=301207 RepID=A0ACB6SFS0_9PLEO|nr:uncharacterized protein BU25DRAFT_329375 [Macroventuria anomochaeta]KAF2633076.1 hypothetical protein BU25DRAFT_329375 [Macroventuria anomochaeta]
MDAEPVLSTAWSKSYKEDAHRFSFLDLPRELRDLIYSYTFHVAGAIFVYTKDPYQPERKLRSKIVRHKNAGVVEPQSVYKWISTGLLQTCRQLHAEAAPVLYGDNTFRIWFLNKTNLALAYCQLVRHVTFTTEATHRIFGPRDLDAVSHGWKHRFWPSILDSGGKMLAQFPNVESLTVPMIPGVESSAWRPAFFAVGGKTAERRIELAAEWMLERSPLTDERLRDCLHLELVPPPGIISREEYAGSRFAPDEEEWDYTEFENAFELMKALD